MADWLPAIATMAVIFWLSSQSYLPSPPDRGLDFALKKLAHAIAYAALALFYLRGVRNSPRAYLLAFLLALTFALTDEFHQSTVPRREATIRDVAIDATAAAVALLWARRTLEGPSGRARRWVEWVMGMGGRT